MPGELTPFRRRTLAHIHAINVGQRGGARCPYGEMVAEADAAIVDGQVEWRTDKFGIEGRWLTQAGRAALASEDALGGTTPAPVLSEEG